MQYDTIIESGPVEAIVITDDVEPVILIDGEPYSVDEAVHLFNVLNVFIGKRYAPGVSVRTEPVGEAA